jgi:hypothetical protein
MQIFNQINSRKLGDDLNIFANFFNNWIFICIMIVTFVVQILIVQYGGIAVRALPLSWAEQGFCFAVGFGGLIWGFLVKVIVPDSSFTALKIDQEPMTNEESANTVMLLRKNSLKDMPRRPS